jgi:hypothetical protein
VLEAAGDHAIPCLASTDLFRYRNHLVVISLITIWPTSSLRTSVTRKLLVLISGQGLTKPVGTGPVSGGTGPARYLKPAGFHPKPNLKISNLGKPAGFTGKPI